jgi:hypothetical protein
MIVSHIPAAAPAPQVEVAATCPRRGSRDCFPELAEPHLTANRGSDRAWFRVQVGGYETLYAATGEPISREFVLDGFSVELESGGFFGDGLRDRIAAEIDAYNEGRSEALELQEFWQLRRPPATEF